MSPVPPPHPTMIWILRSYLFIWLTSPGELFCLVTGRYNIFGFSNHKHLYLRMKKRKMQIIMHGLLHHQVKLMYLSRYASHIAFLISLPAEYFWLQPMSFSLFFHLTKASLNGSAGCASDWWSEGCRFDPLWVDNILSWRLNIKYFLWSFPPFCWFKMGSCQFLAKECAQYWLTAKRTKPVK